MTTMTINMKCSTMEEFKKILKVNVASGIKAEGTFVKSVKDPND
jgi:hypothetical protein